MVYTVATGGYDQNLKLDDHDSAWQEQMVKGGIDYRYFCDAPTCTSVRKVRQGLKLAPILQRIALVHIGPKPPNQPVLVINFT